MSLKPEDLLEENIKESRLMQRLLLGTTLAVLAFGIGRDDARTYQAAYRELNILAGLKEPEYIEFAKTNIPKQSIENTDQITVLQLNERLQKAYEDRNDELAGHIGRAESLARSMSFFPLSTPIESPLQGTLQQVRDALTGGGGSPYILEPDYVEMVGDIDKALGAPYDASMSISAASWSALDCASAPQRTYARCTVPVKLDLDRTVGKSREVFRTVNVSAKGELSWGYTATFARWVEATHPELSPFDKTEPQRRKIGMGEYRHPLPALAAIWDEVSDLTIQAARTTVRKRLDEQLPRVTLFNFSASGEWAYLAASMALLLLSATTAAQFQNLRAIISGAVLPVRRYPWAILHAGRLTALAIILTVAVLPTAVNALLTVRACEARMNTSSLADAYSLLRADRAAVADARDAPYFEFLATDTRDRLHSNLLFGGALAMMTAVTLAFGVRAGATLSRIRTIAASFGEQSPAVTGVDSKEVAGRKAD